MSLLALSIGFAVVVTGAFAWRNVKRRAEVAKRRKDLQNSQKMAVALICRGHQLVRAMELKI
jgi:hypothetical protein